MANRNNYCPRCRDHVFSRRVVRGTPCPRCGQPCVEYGEMRGQHLDRAAREIQEQRDEQVHYSAYGGGTFGED